MEVQAGCVGLQAGGVGLQVEYVGVQAGCVEVQGRHLEEQRRGLGEGHEWALEEVGAAALDLLELATQAAQRRIEQLEVAFRGEARVLGVAQDEAQRTWSGLGSRLGLGLGLGLGLRLGLAPSIVAGVELGAAARSPKGAPSPAHLLRSWARSE